MKQVSKKIPKSLSHQTMTRQRGFKGSKLGPANKGRRLSASERAAIEQRMKETGQL